MISGSELTADCFGALAPTDRDTRWHVRRAILRHAADRSQCWLLCLALDVPYILCPCGRAISNEETPEATAQAAHTRGWRARPDLHRCADGLTVDIRAVHCRPCQGADWHRPRQAGGTPARRRLPAWRSPAAAWRWAARPRRVRPPRTVEAA